MSIESEGSPWDGCYDMLKFFEWDRETVLGNVNGYCKDSKLPDDGLLVSERGQVILEFTSDWYYDFSENGFHVRYRSLGDRVAYAPGFC